MSYNSRNQRDSATINHKNQAVFNVEGVKVYYGGFLALIDVHLQIPDKEIIAFIGPSGCGKSTLLRCFNRMNDLIPGAKVEGRLHYRDRNIYDSRINSVKLRRQVGMVFQRPNPFPKSIYENIAFSPRANGYKGNLDELVEDSLRRAAIWNEVKDKLKAKGTALSGGQQQRLCIARAIAMKPDVLLMDEPCSALDPISTRQVEELCLELKEQYTIIMVTHNMQQASRVADWTAFFNTEIDEYGKRRGKLVEFSPTEQMFNSPNTKEAQEYISGRFG
ncbi:phosphate ABC transporter ATP-binding protein, PhoT family [Trichormus variabilis ATCC 29413]|uniref:Phosphate import ATP-binding protein PstB 1 n=2 Tax=Anabaena variabilis TaxID=264691 RepID=PSTB1_TRIV2|nr:MULTISPECIES: phosphate ABC transporter ATP-binding protein PstB [Nostocaceae]Q3MH62.1 RecName: Full=Phosphate import ATP-binding protein PstB 1; AltName: Full=ABC phosphate transporter 1; AltName: Full=Phosphate-transporting ATPase 1 [Trichormus variabilis ATCC 29413]ABA19674.1 phosphate ABC transporter ATP-binding protein, PhoT family [Trichormus variabilis ATCC 29413]MBC1215824.1 phosphate ABC transporter ATP-binding protein [Trichormus variabilis ARAD]MBC1256534.1 phosphate ABC transport